MSNHTCQTCGEVMHHTRFRSVKGKLHTKRCRVCIAEAYRAMMTKYGVHPAFRAWICGRVA